MDCLNNPFSLKNRKKSSITAAVAVAACSFFTQGTPSAHAFSAPNGYQNGAPFSNGTFFSTSATYQGTIRGKNLSGSIIFSVTEGGDSSDAPNTGIFSVAFNGVTYAGNVNSTADSAAGEIAATMEASVERMGEGELISTVGLDRRREFTTEVITETGTDGIPITIETVSSEIVVYEYTATTDFNDVLYCSGSFIANLFPTYPMQAFKGDGEMSFKELELTFSETDSTSVDIPTIKTTNVDIEVEGVRTANVPQTYTPTTVEVPFAVTTFQVEILGGSSSSD